MVLIKQPEALRFNERAVHLQNYEVKITGSRNENKSKSFVKCLHGNVKIRSALLTRSTLVPIL